MLDNKNIQKVFSLSDFRKKQLVGDVPQRTRETYREYGYFGGGVIGPGSTSRATVDRIDYSNDTNNASARGPLLAARGYQLGGTGNSNFGYFGGGWNSTSFSTVYRTDYSNDSASPTTRGPLSLQRYNITATGNSNFGYFSGGYTAVAPLGNRTFIDRIDYSNDLNTALVRSRITSNRINMGGTGNSNFGYFGGGTGVVATVDRLSYSNDTQQTLVRGPLSQIRSHSTATGNSNFGYFAGGIPSGVLQLVDRINYSNDTTAASPRGSLTLGRTQAAATGNSNFGYFGGGSDVAPSLRINFSQIQRVDYSNDTVTTSTRGNHTSAVSWHAATSSSSFGGAPNSSFASDFTFPTVPNAGYFGGGFDGTNTLTTIDKVDYANDTSTASVRSALSSARYALSATGNGNFGYFAGGRPAPAAPDTSTIDRIEYASDTQNAVARSTLNNAVRLLAAAGNSNFGYFSGGFPTRNGVDRLDYSTDTTATSPRQGLPLATYSLAATGNRNFGYFCGGLTASPTTNRSEIYRVDYSNDSTIPQNRGPLSEAKREGAATGNDNFGYFGGAQNPGLSPSFRTQIERIDYSNDTVITSVRSRLNTPLFATGATGNSNFGYFGAGTNGPANFSTVDRINYSNDTASLSIRGPLSTAKSQLAATSPLAYGGAPIYFTNPLPTVFQKQITFNDSNTLSSNLPFKRVLGSFGYFGGGDGPSSRVDRINYSNDLVTASVRGPLSFARIGLAAAGNNNFGYYAGGINGPTFETVDRIDYSNDSETSLVRGSLTIARKNFTGTGNNNFGYFGGSISTFLNRIDYSNDLSTANRGTLTLLREFAASTGNFNFGYFAGGSSTSIIERVDYSNDLSKASLRGPLSLARQTLSGVGNNSFGYFGGGQGPTSIIDRINYSNDTLTASVRAFLSSAKFLIGSTGNLNFGYFGGGRPSTAAVERIDYTNDTAQLSSRGSLTAARGYLTASTNARSS